MKMEQSTKINTKGISGNKPMFVYTPEQLAEIDAMTKAFVKSLNSIPKD